MLESQLRKIESEHEDREAHLQDQVGLSRKAHSNDPFLFTQMLLLTANLQIKALRARLALTSLEGDHVKAEVQAVRQQVGPLGFSVLVLICRWMIMPRSSDPSGRYVVLRAHLRCTCNTNSNT